jgi:hypothetical protein
MKELLLFRGGVRSVKKTLADGEEHTLYYKARTPAECAAFAGAERRYPDTPEGDALREKTRAKFLAESMCDEAGEPLLTLEEAAMLPMTLKPELCLLIVQGSSTPGEAGKA